MERDAKKMRGERPTLFCDLKSHKGLDDVVGWIKRECLFEAT
jgi:urease accessory protein